VKSKNISFKSFILYDQVDRPINWMDQFGNDNPLDVEIGFGSGEYLVDLARKNPKKNFVGLEQHWQRLLKTLKKIEHEDLCNVRVMLVDARIAFERLFQSSTIENIYCLFPCPWSKKRHAQHRLFSKSFFKLMNNRLQKNGMLKIVTDFLPYREWIMEQLEGSGFGYNTKKIEAKYNTKFEKKWLDSGQKEFFELQMTKKEHLDVPVKEDEKLKAYYADSFDPKKFKIKDLRGSVSVIFKEFLYDQKQKKGLVRLIVSEHNITQNLWITVVQAKKRWCICVTEGYRFIPTQGVAIAIKLVSEAVQGK